METIFPIFDTLQHFEFKSYYVVWKPQEKEEEVEGKVGLNRTM